MKKRWLIGGSFVALGLAASAPAIQNVLRDNSADDAPIVATETIAPPVARPAPRAATLRSETPMSERVATLGILNKRNGLSRDLRMKPGEAVRIGDAVIRLKACEESEPWEHEQLTGGFVQLIVRGADNKWRKNFSGWLYKETPSLNVVEHPIYDIWIKACTMRHPEVGPDTVVLSEVDSGDSTRSRAKKSPPPAPVVEAESAASSNTM